MEEVVVHLCYGVDMFVYDVGKMVHCIVICHLRKKKIGIPGIKTIRAAEQSFTRVFINRSQFFICQ
jgi:hypothetical protein